MGKEESKTHSKQHLGLGGRREEESCRKSPFVISMLRTLHGIIS